jgi:steroid 5-alpha reductase family enzyme
MSRMKAFVLVIIAYVLAGVAAIGTGMVLHAQTPIVIVGLSDLAATLVIFLFSMLTRNSSVYDPYWSVAPVPIALFWLWQPGSDGFANPRHVLIFGLLCLWAIRLTANWALQWRGLSHEDWRYQDIRKQTGALYWPVSFFGIHLMPTILVFLGSLALWPTLSDHHRQLNWLDGVAALVTLAALLIEGTADVQMWQFRRMPDAAEKTIPPGLWSLSRHPNYFGEVLFWWGLFLFVPLASPGFWWTVAGAVAISALFQGISIPLMERHLLARHPSYREYQRHVSRFFPWFPREMRSSD